ncbi:MAG: recombination regulator RecX [Hydrogenophilales bacterium 12-64-13]|nr:MAG: recombination regulator RecX [Hydrogenophilales bacterium 12-64-13]
MKANSTPDPASLRQRALGYLARREHSRHDLTRKLERAGFEPEAIGPVLDEFEEKNWLSDKRFAESWVADHRARAGSVKLAHDLRQHGISDDVIEAVMRANRDSELERARSVWQKKFGTPAADAADKARQIRFMLSRGFTTDVIRHALNAPTGD